MDERIEWPSDRVAQGGMFHPHKVTYSKETHDLIKLLMEEQKLTMFQRNKVNYHLRQGDPLPAPRPAARRQPDYEDQLAYEILQRAHSARKRSLDVIRGSGAYETERYVPLHQLKESSGVQKQRLQEKMSGCKEYPELESLALRARDKFKRKAKPARRDPVEELMSEIQERADWLAEMESLGEDKEHRPVILSQIAERLRQVKKLERERHAHLDSVPIFSGTAAGKSS